MAEELNREGVRIPKLGDDVYFLTEVTVENVNGKIWAAKVTEVVNVEDMVIRLTAFPPSEEPRAIFATVPFDGDKMLNHTWHWPDRV